MGKSNQVSDRGAWVGTTYYTAGDLTRLSGAFYLCLLAHANQSPPNATYWIPVPDSAGLSDATTSAVGVVKIRTTASGAHPVALTTDDIGAANGVAFLDAGSKVTAGQLPIAGVLLRGGLRVDGITAIMTGDVLSVAGGGAGGITIALAATSNPPLSSEIEAALGTPFAVKGISYILQDTNTGRHYLVVSDGLVFSVLPSVLAFVPDTSVLVASGGAGWVWFVDAKAIYHNGKTYWTYIDTSANYTVGQYVHSTKVVTLTVLTNAGTYDDHQVPAIMVRASDSRLLAFYGNPAFSNCYIQISTNPDDATAWGSATNIMPSIGAGTRYYHRPLQLIGETNTPIYLWLSSTDGSGLAKILGYSKSTDGGATWGAYVPIYYPANWVYEKVSASGGNRFDFAVTDNHPYLGVTSIYHFYYLGGSYYKSDGTLITATQPFDQTALTKIYDGTTNRAWIWDVCIDPVTGFPVVVYAVFVTTSDHRYYYGRWTGTAWVNTQICTAGGTISANLVPDPGEVYYSGGIYLDHANPSIVYCSRQAGASPHELWKGVTFDHGATWNLTALTSGSTGKQLRPVCIYNHAPDLKVLWISGTYNYSADWSTQLLGSGR